MLETDYYCKWTLTPYFILPEVSANFSVAICCGVLFKFLKAICIYMYIPDNL